MRDKLRDYAISYADRFATLGVSPVWMTIQVSAQLWLFTRVGLLFLHFSQLIAVGESCQDILVP
jgi:hypothetical protein